jgi:long-subunit fatty acid transport protein
MLIAENDRKTALAKQQTAGMESPMALVEKAMAAVRVAQRAAKQAGDDRIMGWAATVATSHAESIAISSGYDPSKVCSTSKTTPLSSKCSAPKSVSVSSSVSVKDQKRRARLAFGQQQGSEFESFLMRYGVRSTSELVDVRVKLGRELNYSDWKAGRFTLSPVEARLVADEYKGSTYYRCDDDIYY